MGAARRPSPQRNVYKSYSAPPSPTAYSAPAPPPTYNQVSYDYDSYASTTTQATTTTVTLGFCKMTMYDQTYFRGQSVEITGDISDFDDLSFDDEVSSVKIEGDCCWTLYTDSNFQGVSVNLNLENTKVLQKSKMFLRRHHQPRLDADKIILSKLQLHT